MTGPVQGRLKSYPINHSATKAQDPMPNEQILLSAEEFMACGAGQGAECCAYMGVTPDGAACMRPTEVAAHIRSRVAAGTIGARRLPTEPIPECRIFA